MPTGTFDHPFGKGAFGEIAAGLFSVEKRPFAAIAYVYYHHRGVYNGLRDSGNMFAGGGIAYTPIDDDATGKLFSIQLGMSAERTFASEQNGLARADSGASGIFMHPGVVFSTNPSVQFFGLVSLPLTLSSRRVRAMAGATLPNVYQRQVRADVRTAAATPLPTALSLSLAFRRTLRVPTAPSEPRTGCRCSRSSRAPSRPGHADGAADRVRQ